MDTLNRNLKKYFLAARKKKLRMTYSTLTYTTKEGIALITLNRPDQLNAVNSLMSKELPLAWQEFNADDSAIVAILTGSGEKSFCTGADLADLPDMDGEAGLATINSIKWTSLQNNISTWF